MTVQIINKSKHPIPSYETEQSAGMDLRANIDASITLKPLERTIIKRGASIGGGAVILPGLNIGRHSMIAAGAVVTRDVPDFALVKGNPAKVSRILES